MSEVEDGEEPLLGEEAMEIHKKEGQHGSNRPECSGVVPIYVCVNAHDGLTVK